MHKNAILYTIPPMFRRLIYLLGVLKGFSGIVVLEAVKKQRASQEDFFGLRRTRGRKINGSQTLDLSMDKAGNHSQ